MIIFHSSRTPSLDRIDENETTSPETNNRTSDSGIELGNSHGDGRNSRSGSIASSSPDSSTTNNSEVDSSLLYHLSYCERLLDSLGGFGPLKCREIYALDKLKTQSDIIEDLVKIARKGPNVRDLSEGWCDFSGWIAFLNDFQVPGLPGFGSNILLREITDGLLSAFWEISWIKTYK
jgi:hypothetical protein